MAKSCPHCGYSSIGPFIDNCPICAEPVRHVSSSGGSGWAASLPQTLRWVLGGVLVVALGVVGCCGLGMWRLGSSVQDAVKEAEKAMVKAKADAEADRRARTVVVAVADLLQEFGKDAVAADRKYAGKYLEITGVVERSGRGRFDAPFVVLTGGDPDAKLKVECFFLLWDKKEEAQLKRLDKGQSIKVRGEYDGQVSMVQVRDCVLAP